MCVFLTRQMENNTNTANPFTPLPFKLPRASCTFDPVRLAWSRDFRDPSHQVISAHVGIVFFYTYTISLFSRWSFHKKGHLLNLSTQKGHGFKQCVICPELDFCKPNFHVWWHSQNLGRNSRKRSISIFPEILWWKILLFLLFIHHV